MRERAVSRSWWNQTACAIRSSLVALADRIRPRRESAEALRPPSLGVGLGRLDAWSEYLRLASC
jgi:hypothetical protein